MSLASTRPELHTFRPPPAVPARKLNELMLVSTMVMLFALASAWLAALEAQDADQAFAYPAPILAAGLGLALWTEAQAGLRNLVRVDIFMLLVLFVLTFFEFLLPQDSIANRVSLPAAQTAVQATLLGYAGIVLGRHACPARRPLPKRLDISVSPPTTMTLLLGCAFFGYLYMLLAVRFDIFELFYQLTRPRFSQPWTRGRYGSLSTLLNEVGLLKYLIPPLAAAVLAHRRRFRPWQILTALALVALVLFESFAGGTRSVFLIHTATFGAAFTLLMTRLTFGRLAALAAPMLAVAWFAIFYLPEIRSVGLREFDLQAAETETLFVDMNLVNVALLTEVFPERAAFLGLEIPYNAAVRPIPRALWAGKPEELSMGIEEALGVEGLTLSATFVGEFWMSGGYMAVGVASLALGALGAFWNRRAGKARTSTDMILFAVGFFPAGLCMRSFLSVFPALLPLLALIVYQKIKR